MTATLQRGTIATPQRRPPSPLVPAIVVIAAVLLLAATLVVLLRPHPDVVTRVYPLPPLQAAQAHCKAGAIATDGALVVDVKHDDMAGLACLAERLQMPPAGVEALASAISAATQGQVSGRPVSWSGIAADVSPHGEGARVRLSVVDPTTYARLQIG